MAPRDKGKGRASTSSANQASSSPKPSLILQRGKRSFLVALPESYADAIAETRRLFPKLDPDLLVLEREVRGFGWVRLTDSGWESESASLSQGVEVPAVLRVEVDSGSDDDDAIQSDKKRKRCSSESPRPPVLPQPTAKALKAPLMAPDPPDDRQKYQLLLHGSLYDTLVVNVDLHNLAIVCDGVRLRDDVYAADFAYFQAKHELDTADCDVHLDWHVENRGGKPVVYLFPPTPLDSASVCVTLSPEWHFSALYPVVNPAKGDKSETSASWTVAAKPDGSLVDLASGLELKYLFWEAESYKSTSSVPSHLGFDPSNPSLDASNGCALPFASFLAHLDKTLASLSLHTAARNDFITYWLAHFVRIRDAGQHIGFRFLAQADYERAARLDVDPKPDVVTRVFLLFKGVDADEVSEWRRADEVDWVEEVGVEVDKVNDESLFRVLEWGGMEVVKAARTTNCLNVARWRLKRLRFFDSTQCLTFLTYCQAAAPRLQSSRRG